MLICPRHALSFSPLPFSPCVHVECLPGTIKGTGRQHYSTSKPSPLAVFSLTVHAQAYTHTHRLQCSCTLTPVDRKATQQHRRSSITGGKGGSWGSDGCLEDGMRWNEVSDGLRWGIPVHWKWGWENIDHSTWNTLSAVNQMWEYIFTWIPVHVFSMKKKLPKTLSGHYWARINENDFVTHKYIP